MSAEKNFLNKPNKIRKESDQPANCALGKEIAVRYDLIEHKSSEVILHFPELHLILTLRMVENVLIPWPEAPFWVLMKKRLEAPGSFLTLIL